MLLNHHHLSCAGEFAGIKPAEIHSAWEIAPRMVASIPGHGIRAGLSPIIDKNPDQLTEKVIDPESYMMTG